MAEAEEEMAEEGTGEEGGARAFTDDGRSPQPGTDRSCAAF